MATSFTQSRLRRHRRQQQSATQAAAAAAAAPAPLAARADPFKDTANSDKPPEYFELFPASSTTKINTAATETAAPAVLEVTETTPIVQAPASTVIELSENATAAAHSTSIDMMATAPAGGRRVPSIANRKPSD